MAVREGTYETMVSKLLSEIIDDARALDLGTVRAPTDELETGDAEKAILDDDNLKKLWGIKEVYADQLGLIVEELRTADSAEDTEAFIALHPKYFELKLKHNTAKEVFLVRASREVRPGDEWTYRSPRRVEDRCLGVE
jgi:hypothetical protein